MGLFGRPRKKVYGDYQEELDPLPPAPPEEIGEVQNLAKLIWEFETHGISWEYLRSQHESGFDSATRLYKDRIDISNHILKMYVPRNTLD